MPENKLTGEEFVKKPACPFCGMFIERPKELTTRRPSEMPVGSCSCGAVYACDVTGHNLGTAMVEALGFGCDLDGDLAWNLLPGEDYKDEIVERYDPLNHLIVPGGFFAGRRISGVLFFLRLHDDIQEVTAEGVRRRLENATSVLPIQEVEGDKKSILTKKEIKKLIMEFQVSPILNAAAYDKGLIRNLQRQLYSGDELFRKRAAEILGRASAVIGERAPGSISRLLQGLFYSITDTAAFTWGAFEAIGEIISHRTDLYAGYMPQLFQYLGDDTRRADALQAIGRICKAMPNFMRKYTFRFIPYLDDPNYLVRGYTAWLLGNLQAGEVSEDLEKLRDDSNEMYIYEDGKLDKKTVGQVASEALEKLHT